MPGASVVWTALEIHAERISTSQQVIAELNRRRADLPTSSKLSFAESSYDELIVRNPNVKWVPTSGLRMQHADQNPDFSSLMTLNERLQGDFDVALDFEIETLTKPVSGEPSLLAFQIEFPDPEWTRYQAVLFQDSSGMSRLAVHRQCASARTGKDESIEPHAVVLKTVTGLRIARRGQDITMVATSPEYGGEFVLAQFQQSLPPLPTKLNVFARAGGRDAELSILLKQMLLSRQTGEPQPEDRKRSGCQ